MRVVFEFMLFEAGAFFGFFVAALLNAARAGQEITIKFEEEDVVKERDAMTQPKTDLAYFRSEKAKAEQKLHYRRRSP